MGRTAGILDNEKIHNVYSSPNMLTREERRKEERIREERSGVERRREERREETRGEEWREERRED